METLNPNQTDGNTNLEQQVFDDTTINLLAQFDPKSVDQALFKQCKFHPDQDCDFIVITKNAEYSRVCIKCMQEKNILFSNIISIRQLLFANPQPLLSRYPVLVNQEISINELKAANDLRLAVQKQIAEYKKSFNNLMNSINFKKGQIGQEIKEMEESYQDLMNTYADISNINEFKRIIINSKSDEELEIKSFVNAHCEQSEQNSAVLDQKIENFKKVWSNFLVDLHQEDFNQIIFKINQFKFFNFSPNISQKQSIEEKFEGKIEDKCKKSEEEEEEEQNQRQELLQLRQQIKQLQEQQERENLLKVEKITQLESQVHTLQEEVLRLNQQIIDQKSNLKESEQKSKQEQPVLSDQWDKLVEQKLQLQIELDELKQQQAMKGKEEDITKQIEQQKNSLYLYDLQLPEIKENVQELARMISTNNNSQAQKLKRDQIALINQTVQILNDNLIADQKKTKDNLELIQKQQKVLNKQIIHIDKLHIDMREINEKLFEVNSEQINILPNIRIQKSLSYRDSKDLEIGREPNSQIIILKIPKSYSQVYSSFANYAQCYFIEPLKQEKKYKIRLQLNGTSQVAFGLVSYEFKDKSQVQNFNVSYSEIDGGFCRKIVKGKYLDSKNNQFKQGKNLEIRISQKDNIFKVGDYPGYNNVNQIENKFPEWMAYQQVFFAIWLSSESGPQEVRILEVCQSNQFDQKM